MSEAASVQEETGGTVDWQDLWAEFGFDSPDAAGVVVAPRTKLRTALEATEQDFDGTPLDAIATAVDQGELREDIARGHDGQELLRGYLLPEVSS
jgi:hypothetical protein